MLTLATSTTSARFLYGVRNAHISVFDDDDDCYVQSPGAMCFFGGGGGSLLLVQHTIPLKTLPGCMCLM